VASYFCGDSATVPKLSKTLRRQVYNVDESVLQTQILALRVSV
jgi:hypothetical protein